MESRKIITGFANGKTTELIKISNATDRYIVCKDKGRRRFIIGMAMQMGISIPRPIIINEIIETSSKYRSQVRDKILVDDALEILEYLMGMSIAYATTRGEHIKLNYQSPKRYTFKDI